MISIAGVSLSIQAWHCFNDRTSLVWNEEDAEFVDLPNADEIDLLLQSVEPHKPCIPCALMLREEKKQELRIIPGGFTQFGVDYHIGDFIYVRPPADDGVLDIAQITRTHAAADSRLSLFVRYLQRQEQVMLKSDNDNQQLERDEVCPLSSIWICPNLIC